MKTSPNFDPAAHIPGGYLPFDGAIEFYGRIQSILKPTYTVVNLGAGRGAWFFEDKCEARRQLQDIKRVALRVIGLDIDPAVLTNPTTTENHVIKDNRFPLPDACADVIIADYVLEHVEDVPAFQAEIDRVLRYGGYFIARTPHKFQYESIAARLIKNRHHTHFLAKAQPNRKVEDVFPTAYRLNTCRAVQKAFLAYKNSTYLYSNEPTYFFGRRLIFKLLSVLQRILPRIFISNIFVFVQKPASPSWQ